MSEAQECVQRKLVLGVDRRARRGAESLSKQALTCMKKVSGIIKHIVWKNSYKCLANGRVTSEQDKGAEMAKAARCIAPIKMEEL